MENRRIYFAIGSLFLLAITALHAEARRPPDSAFKLTFDKLAAKWTEAVPLGNGRIGAMEFGGTEDERLQINESTLWGGMPHDYTNPGAHAHLEEIRQLIFAGKLDEAEELSKSMMGQPKLLMPYQPFCDMRLHFPGHGEATEYRRELRLDDATAETSYNVGSTSFRREVFISCPDQILAVRITASQPGQLTFGIWLDSPQPGNAHRRRNRRRIANDRADTATPESSFFVDWFVGTGRNPFRGSIKGVGEWRFRPKLGWKVGNIQGRLSHHPVQQRYKFPELWRYRR